ncbi:MAG TPA: AAA domain-containing protein [Tepidisphaeraceae bacterium]|nr:AAA domain-containing protein [Tepidisphaeraceae bacterium]
MSTATTRPNKVLAKMLDRLFAGLMNGPGMNCRPHASRQRIDLTQLSRLSDASPEDVLRQLLSDGRVAKVIAKVKPPRRSDHGENSEGEDEPSSSQKAWDEQTALLNKLRVVADDARTYENDTGVHVLNVGFPLLSLPPGTFAAGSARSSGTKRILAPIAFIPVTLTLKRGTSPSIELACRGEGVDRVMPNSALLAWLEQQTGKLEVNEIFGDDEGAHPWREISDLVAHVAKALNLDVPEEYKLAPKPHTPGSEGTPDDLDASTVENDPGRREHPSTSSGQAPPNPAWSMDALKLTPAPRPDDDAESPAILTSAVLGLFPMANQGLLRDTQAMLAQTEPLSGPVEAFLTAGIDFDDPPPIPATPDEAPPQPEQRVTRLFVTERLAAAADPCQARAVALARASRGLVVHGPPGTGKSQTITNIIADHLARGQRVLFVCEKRTALDVVHDRLDHMGLGQLCGIVHDPQRDQRDLYRSIREQLEELPATKTDAGAEAKLTRVDSELQKLHEDLTQYHHSLMTPPQAGEPSFHELVGQWLALRGSDNQVRVNDTAASAIAPHELSARETELLDLLGRAQAISYARNPWSKCAGVAPSDYLARPMETVRTSIERCVTAAAAADATIDLAIPVFSTQSPLPAQGKARAEIAERLAPLLQQMNGTAVARWAAADAAALRSAGEKLKSIESSVRMFRETPLDADLRSAISPPPSAAVIPQQLRDLDAYLEIAGKWYAFLSFGAKSHAAKVLQPYGLPLTPSSAERVKRFLNALRARLIIQQVRRELAGASDESAGLPADDVLDRFLQHHAELFDILLRLREEPALDGLAVLAAKALPVRAAAEAFIDGLCKSPARADTLAALEDSLHATTLLDAHWLASVGQKLRNGEAASPVTDALLGQLDTLEGVLRVREARAALPEPLRKLADELLSQSADPRAALDALQKSVLTGEITRRLRANPTLQAIDAHRIESNFARYRELELQKKQLVRDAVRHRWIGKQRDRLLAATGSRLNSLGASLSRRLLMSGPRAMRLRQVIAVGEQIDGGDPLFDLCPVWMASPETVAQVFGRKPLFDVIIFDEASQCRLEEALPVLTRGQRVVIAGDPKQLPPTRFFESAFTQSEEQNEPETEQDLFEIQQAEVEDLLGAALNLSIQQCYLDVHYRSRNADLIGFSNENFYGSRLQAIPGHPRNRAKFSPLTLYRVDGVYANRGNEAEADRVVQIVHDLLKRGEPPSIGIACFNLQQRDLIVERLDDRAADDAEFAKRLATARQRKGADSFEGLFVKNLENVQGDERDHIIISTTYGPDAKGKFYRRFGPLGRAGGGRRLNVLVTRARHEVHLVSSIPREAYLNLPAVPEGQSATGAWLLFAYLRYAEQLAALYAEDAASLSEATDAKPQAADRVDVLATKSPSTFATQLAAALANDHRMGSAVHWGNDGFCVDLALRHPTRPDDVTVGVLCDSCRYTAADDPVEWDIFRTGILADQGWSLRRIWTPHFFRDPSGHINSILKDAAAFVAQERPADALPTAQA